MEALRYLTGFAQPVAAGIVHTFDLSDGGAGTLTPWVMHPDCPVCPTAGTAPGTSASVLDRHATATP
jgi:hypothetical protein